MTHRVEVYYSFRSPYSYLATPRMRELTTRYDLEFDVRVVLPIAVRTPEFFQKVNPLWPPYLMRDVHRLGEYLEIPFRWPRPDPVVMDRETMTYPFGAALHLADLAGWEWRRPSAGAAASSLSKLRV